MWFTMLMIGCGSEESTGVWLERTRFGWNGANHRLARYQMGVQDDGVSTTLIGGTSTTGIFTPLDAGCDSNTCDEFPIQDRAAVEIGWAQITTQDAVFGSGSTELVVDAAGVSGTISVPLQHEAKKGEAYAVLRGFDFDTDQDLADGTACYKPANGWLPKGFGLSLGQATLAVDGLSVEVPVTGRFEAGPTYEHERVCLDAVIDQARVALTVHVLAVVTSAEVAQNTHSHDLEYAYTGNRIEPGPQSDPDFAARPLGSTFADPLAGWTAFDFSFHEVGQTRGAYIRTLQLHVDPNVDQAWGHATNFSPGTQLSGFDYAFTGSTLSVDLDETVTRGLVSETVPAAVDDAGLPVQHSFGR